jgi:hypothetical protein
LKFLKILSFVFSSSVTFISLLTFYSFYSLNLKASDFMLATGINCKLADASIVFSDDFESIFDLI